MSNIEIYTQPGCPYCVQAVLLLQKKGADFKEINAPHGTAEREESIRRAGGVRTVPQIFIAGRSVGGCTDLVALDRAGKLDMLLNAA